MEDEDLGAAVDDILASLLPKNRPYKKKVAPCMKVITIDTEEKRLKAEKLEAIAKEIARRRENNELAPKKKRKPKRKKAASLLDDLRVNQSRKGTQKKI